MARGLETLIRLNEWAVDQKRRKLGEVLAMIDGFNAEARKLEEDLIKEQATAAASPNEAGFLYGYYADATIQRRGIIQLSIQQLEKQAEEARRRWGLHCHTPGNEVKDDKGHQYTTPSPGARAKLAAHVAVDHAGLFFGGAGLCAPALSRGGLLGRRLLLCRGLLLR